MTTTTSPTVRPCVTDGWWHIPAATIWQGATDGKATNVLAVRTDGSSSERAIDAALGVHYTLSQAGCLVDQTAPVVDFTEFDPEVPRPYSVVCFTGAWAALAALRAAGYDLTWDLDVYAQGTGSLLAPGTVIPA